MNLESCQCPLDRCFHQCYGHVVGDWTFLTNHARVLACIATEPGVRLRDIAARVDITERAAHRIVCELEGEGYLTRHRVGARNFYEVHPDQPLRHAMDPALSIGDLLLVLLRRERGNAEPNA
jgi:hypothetical protein